MKVLLDGRVVADHFTGIGRYAFGLLRHLPRALPEIEFVVAWNPDVPNRRFQWNDLRDLPNLRRETCAGTGLGPFDPLALRALARREKPDFLHVLYFSGALASPVPTVVAVLDLIPFLPSSTGRLKLRMARAALTHAARRAARVTTLTEVGRAEAVSRLSLDPARVLALPPGIDAPPDGPLPDPALEGRAYVLYVGVQKPHKNVGGLIEAFAKAFPRDDIRLAVTGPPSAWTAGLRARAAQLGLRERVRFTGSVAEEELGGLYRRASALALLSFDEGFGIPMLEAMSVGTPVVASDRPVFHEVCGEAAFYARPDQVAEMSAALRRAITPGPEREAVREAGLRRASDLAWERVAPRYRQCYSGGAAS